MSTGEKNSKIEDGHLDHTLRPGKWDDYVGQETNKPGKATSIARPSNVPIQPPSMKLPEQPTLVPPTGPLPKLQAPNIAINLKPPTMPPQ